MKMFCGPRRGPVSASGATIAGDPHAGGLLLAPAPGRRVRRRIWYSRSRAARHRRAFEKRRPALISVKPTAAPERQLRHDARDLRRLRRVRLQELAPRRQVVEEVLDVDAGPFRHAGLGHGGDGSAMDADLGAASARPRARVRSVRCDTDAMRGSASPRKPSVRDRGEVFGALRILLVACRSSASRASSAIHAVPVVLDAHQALAAVLDGDGDAARAGVDGVLDQLLDDRGGPLDDLAGRDLVCEVRRAAGGSSARIRANSACRGRTRASGPPTATAMPPRIHQNGAGIVLAGDAAADACSCRRCPPTHASTA